MRHLLLATAAAAALATPAFAAAAAAGPDENIVITGRLEETVPQELGEIGNRVEVVTAEEILNGGYVDVTQALVSQVPGLYIAPLSGPFDYHEASFQGSRTSEMLWMIDGVRINNRLYSTTPPLDTIPAHMIERIEVVEGGQALFFGTQAVAGAINIVTKEFSATPDGVLSVGGGSNEEAHVNGYFRDTLGPHQIVVYGSADHAKGFQPFPDEDYQPSATDRNRGYDVLTLGGKYGINLGGDARFSANYQHTAATLDFPRPFAIAKAYNVRKEDLVSAKFDWSPTDNFDFFLKGYYHWWDTLYTEYDNDIENPGNLIIVDDADFWGFEDYGINALGKYSLGNGIDLYGGYDYQNYWGEDQVFLIKKQTESVHAPFAQIRTTDMLIPNVKLSAGIRHNAPSDGQSSTIWNVSGQWDITPNLFVKGSGGTAFRLPDAYELYVVDPCCEQGNPNLKAEESTNFNGSIGGTLPLGMATLSWEAVGFMRDIKKRIEIVFDPVQNIDTFANSGPDIEVRGAELILGVNIGTDFAADFSYTFTSSEAEGANDQLPDVPEALAKAVFDYHPMDLPFGASLTINHVGGLYRVAAGRQEYGDYTVVDLGLRAFVDPDRKHRIGLNVQNLFDEEYATRVRSVTPDNGGPAYPYHFLGMPQTFQVTYSYAF